MEDYPTVTIYCDGPPDNVGEPTHERYEIITYKRIDRPHYMAGLEDDFAALSISDSAANSFLDPVREWMSYPKWDDGNRTRRARLHRHDRFGDGRSPLTDDGSMAANLRQRSRQLRFWCELCGFDEQRNDVGAALADLLDQLIEHRQHEISARNVLKFLPTADGR